MPSLLDLLGGQIPQDYQVSDLGGGGIAAGTNYGPGTPYQNYQQLRNATWLSDMAAGKPSVVAQAAEAAGARNPLPETAAIQSFYGQPGGAFSGGGSRNASDLMAAMPDVGKASPLGGFFTYQNQFQNKNQQVPETIAVGSNLPSTDNWQLLPPPYNRPGFIMRNGNIINKNSWGYQHGYPANWPSDTSPVAAGPTRGFPGSIHGASWQELHGWPGSIEPWVGSGGTGTY